MSVLDWIGRGAALLAAAARGWRDGWRRGKQAPAAPPAPSPSFQDVLHMDAQAHAGARPFCGVCGRARIDGEGDWQAERNGSGTVVHYCPVHRVMGRL